MIRYLILIVFLCNFSSCSIDQFALSCETNADCDNTSICDDGICVSESIIAPEDIEIALNVDDLQLLVGDTSRVVATVSAGGRVISDNVEWSTSDPAVISIDMDGDVNALTVGTAEIVATFDDVVARLNVEVYSRVAEISLSSQEFTIGRGVGRQLIWNTTSGDGNPIDVPVQFLSSNGSAVEVSRDGLLTGLNVGTSTISVLYQDLRADAFVTVEENEVARVELFVDDAPAVNAVVILASALELEARVFDVNDNRLDPRGRTFDWAFSEPTVGSVGVRTDQRSFGSFIGLGVGEGVLTISADARIVGAFTITVAGVAVSEVGISPVPAGVPVFDVAQMNAVVTDAAGNILNGVNPVWTSSNNSVATITPEGVVTGISPGTTQIAATIQGKTATLELDVRFRLSKLSTGDTHSCGLTPQGIAACWGSNVSGELGRPGAGGAVPEQVTTTLRFASIAVTRRSSCGLTPNNEVWCWGGGPLLGDAAGTSSDIPIKIEGEEPNTYSYLSCGFIHCCAVTTGLETVCWGSNALGQTGGDGATRLPRLVPMTIEGNPIGLVSGRTQNCLYTATKTYCWGDNRFGQLGDGATSDAPVAPTEVSHPNGFSTIGAGNGFTCGSDALTNASYCWGLGANFRTGLGINVNVSVPNEQVGMTSTSIAGGTNHGCSTNASQAVYCWGESGEYQTGTGVVTDLLVPTPIASTVKFGTVTSGNAFSCAIAIDEQVYCWGLNDVGQSGGLGVQPNVMSPSLVYAPAPP